MHRLWQRHFSCSPRCMATCEERGWSGALQQLPGQARSCAMAGDRHWGSNPALDPAKVAEGVEGAVRQTQVEVSAMFRCPAFLTVPWERLTCSKPSSNEAEMQSGGQGSGAPATCPSPLPWHLAQSRSSMLGWGCFLRSHLHALGGTWPSPTLATGH